MGKNNRQRRRMRTQEKRRHRDASPAGGQGPSTGRVFSVDDPAFLADGFARLAEASAGDHHTAADQIVGVLVAAWDRGSAAAASAVLHAAVVCGWENGWQPTDLVHAFGRKLSAPDRRLLTSVVLADAPAWRSHPDADPAWIDQLDQLAESFPPDSVGGVSGRDGVIAGWTAAERLARADALLRAASLLALLWRMPVLPPVADPPSSWGKASVFGAATRRGPVGVRTPRVGAVDERMLDRVRALLAKAESTEFAPEAESLTAKAQELAARYSIDQALLSPSSGGRDRPVARRFLIHDPYAKGKSHLLSQVAAANRCQAVWSKSLGLSTVFGFATDLAVTDLLYTSLVSQCSAAMRTASPTAGNPRSFRDSFVLSFAIRIGERLESSTAATVSAVAAERGESLLPVLASREADVEAARDEAFPHLVSNRLRISDERGWVAGRAAAEVARLEVGRAVERAAGD